VSQQTNEAETARARLIESANRLGVELDEVELEKWMTAVTTTSEGTDIVMDEATGVFGHRVSMLDFSPEDLARFRAIGKIVEFDDTPGVIETALALSGSAAQSKIQTYPGDCDFFERVNIIAPTRAQACDLLADLIRQKALNYLSGPNYQLIEVNSAAIRAMSCGMGRRNARARPLRGCRRRSPPGGLKRPTRPGILW